jgi:hypothetical protein
MKLTTKEEVMHQIIKSRFLNQTGHIKNTYTLVIGLIVGSLLTIIIL